MYKYFLVLFLFIATPSFAETKIHCPKCLTHLYTVLYDIKEASEGKRVLSAKDIVASKGIPHPEESDRFICPLDQTPLNGYEYWFHKRGLPETRLAYQALTVLTDIDGKLVWYPYEILLRE